MAAPTLSFFLSFFGLTCSISLSYLWELLHIFLPLICSSPPETQLSISPNRLVTGITRLRFLSNALLCCIVQTPTLTRVWRHRKKNFYTLFIRGATTNWLGVCFFSPVPLLVLKSGEWKVAGWSADLNLKGCAVISRGEPGQLCYASPLSTSITWMMAGKCIELSI